MPTAVVDGRVSALAGGGLAAETDGGVALTDAGRALFDRIVPAHLENERRLLSALTETEQEQLGGLLRKLLGEFEGSRPVDDGPPRLGLTLTPSHMTADLREAVDLPPATGLLVRTIDRDGPGARAGLRVGDVLLRSGQRELRSVAALYAVIAEEAPAGSVRLQVLHGEQEREVTLDVDAPLPPAASPGRASFAEHLL